MHRTAVAKLALGGVAILVAAGLAYAGIISGEAALAVITAILAGAGLYQRRKSN